ncbi:uncharacterized protein METZ01_LOCUS52167 [marine metagenome]|uniref:Uncharacterized protein n=1 Tax=marine metagenome TaxID=408172 RepID=A0A381SDV9_9ZZZZ
MIGFNLNHSSPVGLIGTAHVPVPSSGQNR